MKKMARSNYKIIATGWEKKFEETYGRPPTGLEMDKFRKYHDNKLPQKYYKDDDDKEEKE